MKASIKLIKTEQIRVNNVRKDEKETRTQLRREEDSTEEENRRQNEECDKLNCVCFFLLLLLLFSPINVHETCGIVLKNGNTTEKKRFACLLFDYIDLLMELSPLLQSKLLKWLTERKPSIQLNMYPLSVSSIGFSFHQFVGFVYLIWYRYLMRTRSILALIL